MEKISFIICLIFLAIMSGRTLFASEEIITPVDHLLERVELTDNFDRLFYAYGSCLGLDHRFLKAVAKAESDLNIDSGRCVDGTIHGLGSENHRESIEEKRFYFFNRSCSHDKKYVGLFQTSKNFCRGALASYTDNSRLKEKRLNPPESLNFHCEDTLAYPDLNTAISIYHLEKSLRRIERYCPDSNEDEKILLLYVGHNNGPAVLRTVLQNGGCYVKTERGECRENNSVRKGDMRCWVRNYYDRELIRIRRHNRRARIYNRRVERGEIPGPKKTFRRQIVDANWGEGKWRYGQKIVRFFHRFGGEQIFQTFSEEEKSLYCPLIHGQRIWPDLVSRGL